MKWAAGSIDAHNEQCRSLTDGYMLGHRLKPQVTGLAQVDGPRGENEMLETTND
jgi:hypothetical protein